jgi:hypothetical protein
MNIDRLKRSVAGRVQLRPMAIPLESQGRGLPPVDDYWLIESVKDSVRISNVRTGHFTNLGFDHVHHYTSNPDVTKQSGIEHGFFTLNVQIYLQGTDLTITPTHRPGEAVLPAHPAIETVNVDFTYPVASGLQARLREAGFQIAWVNESRVHWKTELDGWSLVVDRRSNGQPVSYRLRTRPEDQILLMKAEQEN